MRTSFIIIIICIVVGLVIGFYIPKQQVSSPQLVQQPAVITKTTAPTATPVPHIGKPQRLVIPSINVSVPVESVGKDEEGNMGLPRNIYNTGWYNRGPNPGEQGNAVIAGHYDTPSGKPSVFYSIDSLKKGDKIQVLDSDGNTHTFAVTSVTSYEDRNFPIGTVFGEYNKARLNLITCGGKWNRNERNYTHRTVVFSEKVNTQTIDTSHFFTYNQ